MFSRVFRHVDNSAAGIRKSNRVAAAAAEQAADLGQNSAGDISMASQDKHEVADIHTRLDEIARQIKEMQRTTGTGPDAGKGKQDTARGHEAGQDLAGAMSRLDARLNRVTEPSKSAPFEDSAAGAARAPSETAGAAQREAAGTPPLSLEAAIAEIAARQKELYNTLTPPQRAPKGEPKGAPASAEPDFSSLHAQLVHITSQIDALRLPDNLEESIAQFRKELAEIRAAMTEALPARAIEALEGEIRELSRRIDEGRQNGADSAALAGIERALVEIRDSLRVLTPAEQLAGFDEAVRSLGNRIDTIMRASDDPSTVNQLEDAISALRSVVTNIASTETLERLSSDVHKLASRIDQLTETGNGTAFAALEQRIAEATSALESRVQPAHASFDAGLQALAERIDNLRIGQTDADMFAHLEQRIGSLLERLEASNGLSADLSRVENGLNEILTHLEEQRSSIEALQRSAAPPSGEPSAMETIKRDLSDMRHSYGERDRAMQDSLEVVHTTLGHVVDRLAMIEGELRVVQATSSAASSGLAQNTHLQAWPPRPDLPNPVTATMVATPPPSPPEPPRGSRAEPNRPTLHDTPDPKASQASEPNTGETKPAEMKAGDDNALLHRPHPMRPPIDPSLPPDHPLEPGSRAATPSERIAASQRALGDLAPGEAEPVNTRNFIAAARRAAQAAASEAPVKSRRAALMSEASRHVGVIALQEPVKASHKLRTALIGAGAVVLTIAAIKVASMVVAPGPLLGPSMTSMLDTVEDDEDTGGTTASIAAPTLPTPAAPSVTSPTPLERQTMAGPSLAATASGIDSVEITGSVKAPEAPAASPLARPAASLKIPASEILPEAIGSQKLRNAALHGDPAAAYEIAVRYAEGTGVAGSYEEAAKWYERAAQGGIVPAIFRLGTLYEKGLGVKKNLETARDYYTRAAERGNAKAMHNLAVLDADGGGNGANYKSAAKWFHKAAERGIADSQYNLGILYARGIGVDQNLPESYKWFSLAAAQGDFDAGQKRDEIAKRLDPQSLAAAKLAVQTFQVIRQPDDAVNVFVPEGGWNAAQDARRGSRTAALQRPAR
ncbi:MAG TPA: hypothetical protein VNZ94_13070 [Xanthobacteraceae bacterium]|nr:hypothetical protein [Xanthobacteraceae bacterium]